MMKKAAAVALAALMALSAVGCGSSSSNSSGDIATIKKNGKLVVGITDFAPMDYKDKKGNWIGFDADLGKQVAKDLGVKIEFTEIDWDNKLLELKNKSVDAVWNGMTLTNEVKNSMSCTNPYLQNAQTVVLPKDKISQYKTVDDLKGLSLAVEAGSAGEQVAKDNKLDYTERSSQSDTLLEVKAGTADGAIIDLLMAGAMIGDGTDYSDLAHTMQLSKEEYVVGCRKGSDLTDYLNKEFAKFEKDGTLQKIAKQYGVQDALISQSGSSTSAAEATSDAASTVSTQ